MKKSMRETFGNSLVDIGKKNLDIIVVDADLSSSTRTDIFRKIFPDRFINVGIAEQNLIGISGGLATTGKNVFASSFAVFIVDRAYETIRNMICIANLNVKICATHGGIMTGPDGGTHQAIEDISVMRSLPNMNVLVPCCSKEVESMVKYLSNQHGPAYLRLVRDDVEEILPDDYEFELGKSVRVINGDDISIIACGPCVKIAMDAAEKLMSINIKARVINMSTIKPIDKEEIILCAKETKGIVTIEDHSIIGGLGSSVSEIVSEYYPARVLKIGIEDRFGISGNSEELYEYFGLTVDNICDKVLKILKREF